MRKEAFRASPSRLHARCSKTTARARGIDHPLTVHLRNNLALTLLMLDRVDEARHLLAESWRTPAPNYSNLTPRIPYLALLADRLRNNSGTGQIGRLKTLLCGPELPRAPGVAHPWDVAYLLDYLRPKLPPDSHEFLAALLAAINVPPGPGPGSTALPRAWRSRRAGRSRVAAGTSLAGEPRESRREHPVDAPATPSRAP